VVPVPTAPEVLPPPPPNVVPDFTPGVPDIYHGGKGQLEKKHKREIFL
jgi:hypothetical protein